MPSREKLTEFTAWCVKHIAGDEKSEAQIFLDQLFHSFGHAGGLKDAGATLEFRVTKDTGGTSFADLVWKAAFEELTASRQGPRLLLRVYQAAFQEVARKSGYSVELISVTILEAFRSRAEELGEGFLESVLRVATAGPKPAQDSRREKGSESNSDSAVKEEPGDTKTWLFATNDSSNPVSYRKTRKSKP